MLLPSNKQLLTKVLAGSEHITTTSIPGKENETGEGSPTVRFASVNEEIEPEKSLEADTNRLPGNDVATLKELSKSLQGTQLQGRRMSHFAFEPVSLPVSRVCLHLSCLSKCQDRNLKHPDRRAGDGLVYTIHSKMEDIIPIAKFILDFPWDAGFPQLCAFRRFNTDPPPRTYRKAFRDLPHSLALIVLYFFQNFFFFFCLRLV
jgi:hypothetical protein